MPMTKPKSKPDQNPQIAKRPANTVAERVTVLETRVDTTLRYVATKEDLAEFRGATREDLAEFRGATKKDIAELGGKTEAKFGESEGKLDTRFAELEGKMDAGFARVDTQIADLRAELSAKLLTHTLTTVGFLASTMIGVGMVIFRALP